MTSFLQLLRDQPEYYPHRTPPVMSFSGNFSSYFIMAFHGAPVFHLLMTTGFSLLKTPTTRKQPQCPFPEGFAASVPFTNRFIFPSILNANSRLNLCLV